MPIRHARLITACGLIRKKVVDCGISDRNILSSEYRPVHNLYITLNRFFMAYIHLHRKEMYYTQFFYKKRVYKKPVIIFFKLRNRVLMF